MAIYKKHYVDLSEEGFNVTWRNVNSTPENGYVQININDNTLYNETVYEIEKGKYYISREEEPEWPGGWVGIYTIKDNDVKRGVWFLGRRLEWKIGDYIEDVEGDYPDDGIEGDFWYVFKEGKPSEPEIPSATGNIFAGGYIGKEPVKALYRGSELLWRAKPDYPDYYVMAEDSDFRATSNPKRFEYIGTKDYIILPTKIHGVDYEIADMFADTAIKGVAGTARGDARGSFRDTTSKTLELLYLDTGNITGMAYMFWNSQATVLDLSSFDTSNVTNTNWMFGGAKATTGYARTQEDADKFNNSSDKPDNLIFVVKQG